MKKDNQANAADTKSRAADLRRWTLNGRHFIG